VLRRERAAAGVTRGPLGEGALRIHISGIVQGVGFRPFVYRLAARHSIAGWVRNGERGVEIHAQGGKANVDAFVAALTAEAPAAAVVAEVDVREAPAGAFSNFAIEATRRTGDVSVRVSPDLAVCVDCLLELRDPSDRRFGYAYVNCTNCGPRYTIVTQLPYDRPNTTMRDWAMCEPCAREYRDPLDRRFHAQPVACPRCGPEFVLEYGAETARGRDAVLRAAELLRQGNVLALKGLGGYHVACDAANLHAVRAIRERKFRKERPFAVMVRDLDGARALIHSTPEIEKLLASIARPIVLAPARRALPDVAPDNRDLGIMLAHTPLHHALFDAGAPPWLVMTSGNRSSEPIAYDDGDARQRLEGIVDGFVIGERAIARRLDDSVVRVGPNGPSVLRHGRGYAPRAVASLPSRAPILAVGGDLKNALVLVVEGQAFAGQHLGDLEHYDVARSFRTAIDDMCAMYDVDRSRLTIAHDAHPQYVSTQYALGLEAAQHVAVQHHRAHVASVLAERGELDRFVVGFGFDGTGYGDDGTIWGGEVFAGSVRDGFVRALSLRPALLPGGDAAARHPVAAAAGFLLEVDDLPDLSVPPFSFPPRYDAAVALARSGIRTFATTSMGRLFDAVAALLGFTREMTFEGQAAMWVEQLARDGTADAYAFPVRDGTLDYRPLLASIARNRRDGRDPRDIACAFHGAVAQACVDAAAAVDPKRPVVASGGVFQNGLLIDLLAEAFGERLWLNTMVPPNDGGIALGQAATAAVRLPDRR
jgi:hydrogenase maturation protein HypF